VSANEAWYGGKAGQLYQWKDGTILTYTSPLTYPIAALDMVSPTMGWASVDEPLYKILRYSDGAWTAWTVNSSVRTISALGREDAWFGTWSDGFRHYNAGVWESQSVPYGYHVNSISMLDSNHGWASVWGNLQSRIYSYTNGLWSTITPTLMVTGTWGELKIIGVSPDEAWVAGWSMNCTAVDCPATPQLHHFSSGTWTSISTPDWLGFYDISKISATEWWAAGKLTTMEYAFLHYKDGTYTVVPAAGEDVIGVSMLPDGSGFARGVGSLLQLNIFTHRVYLPIVTR
jgi:hypothetical protein